jgi:hypothetical protein
MKFKLVKAFPWHTAVWSIYDTDMPWSDIDYAKFPDLFQEINERKIVPCDFVVCSDWARSLFYDSDEKQEAYVELMEHVHEFGKIDVWDRCNLYIYNGVWNWNASAWRWEGHILDEEKFLLFTNYCLIPWWSTKEDRAKRKKLIFNFIKA